MAKILSVEKTSNPDALKINVGDLLSKAGPKQFQSRQESRPDPLANAIFAIGGIDAVFYTDRFITVNKKPEGDWNQLEPKLIRAIEAVEPETMNGTSEVHGAANPAETGDELLDRINQVVDEKIRPALESHGGGLEILGLDGNLLTIRYQGACGGCPSAIRGTMMAIQNLLRQEVDPEIEVVSA